MNSNPTMQTEKTQNIAEDSRLSSGTKEFLKVLNLLAPPELERLSPEAARKVLVSAQAAVEVNYSGVDESEKPINADGYKIKSNCVEKLYDAQN